MGSGENIFADTTEGPSNPYAQSEEDKVQQLRVSALYHAIDLARLHVVTSADELVGAAKRIEQYLKTGA